MSIQNELMKMAEPDLQAFSAKLVPTIPKDRVLGIRIPKLRAYAKAIAQLPEAQSFLEELPHCYLEENTLHAFLIAAVRDYDTAIELTERFLPYIDNWATCDSMSPAVFRKHRSDLLDRIQNWLKSGSEYTVRFGLKMLMDHYLDEDFDPTYLRLAASVKSEAYYINMMQAWYFATALAKQYNETLSYLEQQKLDKWVHNKTIQKARESFRITPEQKEYLKTLKIR